MIKILLGKRVLQEHDFAFIYLMGLSLILTFMYFLSVNHYLFDLFVIISFTAIHLALRKYEIEAVLNPITKLPNKIVLLDYLERASKVKKDKKKFYFILFTLENIKKTEIAFGAPARNEVLRQLGDRLKHKLRQSDLLIHFSDTEFVILIHQGSQTDINRVCTRLLQTVQPPFVVNADEIILNANIGVAKCENDNLCLTTAYNIAYMASQAAQFDSLGYYIISDFNSDERSNVLIDSFRLASDLHLAIKKRNLDLVFQPQLDLATGKIKGVECLARWEHPTNGFISPQKFITIAEENGIMDSLTSFIFHLAYEAHNRLALMKFPIKMSVNITPSNLANPKLLKAMMTDLKQLNIEPSKIMLEVTESAIRGNIDRAIVSLLSASELGFDLSIDDFGIGFSSYFYLKNLPIKEIKIDKLFIDGLLSNDADGIIIKHIIDLAHSVDCEVIAEGVETEEQIARLKELGCDAIQGFCYSKPLSFVDLVTFIKAQS